MGGILFGVGLNPALDSCLFTILLLVTILGGDELWLQGDDTAIAWSDNNWRNRAVGIGGYTVLAVFREQFGQ